MHGMRQLMSEIESGGHKRRAWYQIDDLRQDRYRFPRLINADFTKLRFLKKSVGEFAHDAIRRDQSSRQKIERDVRRYFTMSVIFRNDPFDRNTGVNNQHSI